MGFPGGAAAAAKSLQSCPTLCDPRDGSPPGSCPWDSPGKNTGVGCHFLLQCVKGKSESEVAQSCPTLRDPMDCRLPGSTVHGIFQGRGPEWGAIAFSTQVALVVKKKKTTCQCRSHTVSLPGSGRCPRGGQGDLLQYSCLESSTGQRSLAGYSL